MTTNIERIVRPAIPTDPHPPRVQLPSRDVAADEVVLEFGSAGNSVFVAQLSTFAEFTVKEEQVEISRKVDIVRVAHKDDPETYLDVEVVKEWEARNTLSNKRTTYRMYNPANPNVFSDEQTAKVIKKDVLLKNPDAPDVSEAVD